MRWLVVLCVCVIAASASVGAIVGSTQRRQGTPPNPLQQRVEMIRALRSIDQKLSQIHGTLQDISKQLPKVPKK